MDSEIRQALREIEQVLMDAIASSPEAGHALQRLRESGFSVYLAVDCADGDEGEAQPLELPASAETIETPVFRIDRRDLSFLRSIGIDPTRETRRRG